VRRARWQGLVPLRHRRFRLLAAGQFASNLGDAFYAVALPWYVLRADRGAVLLGVVLAAYGIARAATLLAGGSAADRWRPWTVMLVADSVRAVLLALLAVVVATSGPTAWELVPIGVLVGAGEGLFLPGSSAVVPSLLPDEALEAGNAVLSGSTQLTGLVGPAIGGAVVAVTGPRQPSPLMGRHS
jgi:MFS family permease